MGVIVAAISLLVFVLTGSLIAAILIPGLPMLLWFCLGQWIAASARRRYPRTYLTRHGCDASDIARRNRIR